MRAPLGAHHRAIAAFRGRAHKRRFALSYLWVHAIDIGPQYRYITPISFPEGTFESGTRAVPARGVTTRARAAPGISHAGTTAGAGGAVPGLGQVKAGNARRDPRPRKHGLELSRL